MNPHAQLLCPVEYTDPQQQQAHTLYVCRGYPIVDVSEIADVPMETLTKWIADGYWVDRRTQFLEKARDTAAASVGLIVADKAGSLIRRYVGLQESLLEKLEDAVEKAETISEINTLAKAISSNFGIADTLLKSAKVSAPDIAPPEDAPPATLVQINVLNSLGKAVKELNLAEEEE